MARRPARRWLDNVRRGRTQRTFAAAASTGAAALGVEIWLEHYKASFGDKWMWTPIALSPPLAVAGAAMVLSPRAGRTLLPLLGALYAANGMVGVVTHIRGVARKPGGFREPTYNLVMGPPVLAPGALVLVGGFAILAAFVDRER